MPAAKQSTPVVREFATGANRDRVDGKLDFRGFVSPKALRRFGAFMNKNRRLADGSLRDSDNWKKGIPISVYIESLIRHGNEFHESIEEAIDGAGIEKIASMAANDARLLAADDIACALLFNIQGYLHERIKLLDATDAPYPGKRVHGKPPLGYADVERLVADLVSVAGKKIYISRKAA